MSVLYLDERSKVICKITCIICKNYAWTSEMNPIMHTKTKEYHHPSCLKKVNTKGFVEVDLKRCKQ